MLPVSSGSPKVVAVTGASGYIGSALLRELEQHEELEKVVATDIRPLRNPVHNVAFYRRDIAEPLGELFRDHRVDSVVHLAFVMKPGRNPEEVQAAQKVNIGGLENVLQACHAARVRHLVYLSSHTVYGAHRDNPVPITEEAPARPNRGFQYAQHKVQCEELISQFCHSHPGTRATILRSCVVMGPTAENFVTQALSKPFLVGVLGNDPLMQFVHESDLARLMAHVVLAPRPGVYNVAGERVVPYSRLAEIAGRPVVFLPSALVYPLTQFAWQLGIQKDSPAVGIDLIRYPMLVSTGKVKGVTGFRFRYTSAEALEAFTGNMR